MNHGLAGLAVQGGLHGVAQPAAAAGRPVRGGRAGIVRDVEGVRHLAELGVVFLLFNIGLELSLERLRSMQRFVFGLGGLQVQPKVYIFYIFI